jgi:2'-5' RNA ligase
LDQPDGQIVREMQDALAEAGIPVVMGAIGAQPHVALAVFEDTADEDRLAALAQEAAHDIAGPVEFLFTSLGVFPTTSVVFLAPKPEAVLLALHEAFHARIGDLARDLVAYYAPDQWVPHCTVEMDIPPGMLGIAAARCAAVFRPMRARASALTLIRFRPVETIASHRLE